MKSGAPVNCHDFEDAAGLDGPAMVGYLSREWVASVVADGGAEHLYGEANTMPLFGERLTGEDINAVVTFVVSIEARPAKQTWPWTDDPGPVATPRTTATSTAP